jgi:hypothetical protein
MTFSNFYFTNQIIRNIAFRLAIRYTNAEQINRDDLKRWLEKSKNIQWDYKNLIKRKGELRCKMDVLGL